MAEKIKLSLTGKIGHSAIIGAMLVLIGFMAARFSTDAATPFHGDEMKVVSINSLTHPRYGAVDIFYGVKQRWNQTSKRILFFESKRSLCWGYVEDLKSWTTEAEYHQASHEIGATVNGKDDFHCHMHWSLFPGEENILYGAYRPSKMICRYNVDTKKIDPVISYDYTGKDVSKAAILGWTVDTMLVMAFQYDAWDKGGLEFDIRLKTRKYHVNGRGTTTNDRFRWPGTTHGHSSISPDHTLRMNGPLRKWPSGDIIRNLRGPNQFRPSRSHNHISWKHSNKWWVMNDAGERHVATGGNNWAPYIDMWAVAQCWVDGTCRMLNAMGGAQSYHYMKDGKKTSEGNYYAIPIVSQSPDGRQVVYTTTDGVFTSRDKRNVGASPSGTYMLFHLQLEPVGANPDQTPPSSPGKVTATALSTSKVLITWDYSTDPGCAKGANIEGYDLYRGDARIKQTGFWYFLDSNCTAATTYKYSLVARDSWGNASPKTAEVSVTTLKAGDPVPNIKVPPAWPYRTQRPSGIVVPDRRSAYPALHLPGGNLLVGTNGLRLRYQLPRAVHTRISVMDAHGRLVRLVTNKHQNLGFHTIAWDGQAQHGRIATSGVYFFRLEAGDRVEMKRIVLMR